MRYYFFGDIHGNMNALEAILAFGARLGPDEIICLGDLVGWLPYGDQSLKRLRPLALATVAGNHDLLVTGAFDDDPAQVDRQQATACNRDLLTGIGGAMAYLESLPLSLERSDFIVVHHSPFDLPQKRAKLAIQHFGYLDNAALKRVVDQWAACPWRLIISGHDHIPAVYALPTDGPDIGSVRIYRPSAQQDLHLRLEPGVKYWVKSGSVGGPYRDGRPWAGYTLYDSRAGRLTLGRIAYPLEPLYAALRHHPLTRQLPTLQRYVQLLVRTMT
jgi:predicted phosphodiesterase